MRKSGVLVVGLMAFASVGCGGGGSSSGQSEDAGGDGSAESSPDAGSDATSTGPMDAGADEGTDAGTDATSGGMDAGNDAAPAHDAGATDSGATVDSGSSMTDSGAVADGGADAGAAFSTFPFPTVNYGGGPVVAAPEIITITFSGNTFATHLDTFGDGIAASSYWSTVTSDLTCNGTSACIGAGPAGASAVSSVAIGASYADTAGAGGTGNTLQPFLQSVIAALPSAMQPAADSLYVFYVPTTTTVSLDGSQSCAAFGGYHNVMTIGSASVPYAMVFDCGARETLTEEQSVTFAASHEMLEGASDPTLPPNGYYIDENYQNSLAWETLGLGELGDLCVDLLGLGEDLTTENGFSVQRIWSPTNAAAGNLDPCVPSNGQVYFNAFPTVSAVIVDVGKTQTFEIDALALGSEPTWTVGVQDATVPGQADQYLAFSSAGGTNVNGVTAISANSGDQIQVTVSMLKDPATAPGSLGWGLGLVTSYAGTNPAAATAGHFWPFIVLTTAEATADGITMSESVPFHGDKRLALPRVRAKVPRSRFLDPLRPLFR